MKDIFGNKLSQEETITFIYKGDKFVNHEIELGSLVSELKGVETLIKETIAFYSNKHGLSGAEIGFDIYVKIEDGSIKQVIKIVKKNAAVISLVGVFVMPFIQSGFEYYLNHRQTENPEVVQILEDNKKIRQSFANILVPITGSDNVVSINTGDVTYEINNEAKEEIVQELKKHEELLNQKEIIKEEDLFGVVSVSKLYDPSPFSFRVKETTQDIPLFFQDINFDLQEKQDFLGKELLIKSKVTYKNNKRVSISVVEYKLVAKLFDK